MEERRTTKVKPEFRIEAAAEFATCPTNRRSGRFAFVAKRLRPAAESKRFEHDKYLFLPKNGGWKVQLFAIT
jgi:hypothetical protein